MSSGTELSAVIFGQHVRLVLIFVIFFFFCGCLKDNGYNIILPTNEKLKENIRKKIANIAAEQLQGVNQNLFRRCKECLRVEG
jgi:hypothetical protein